METLSEVSTTPHLALFRDAEFETATLSGTMPTSSAILVAHQLAILAWVDGELSVVR